MTLTPCFLALAMIAEPEPASRSTSSSTFAPFVIACSAWVRCAAGSPSALTMVASTPAFLKASPRYLRSWVSQRTDDLESGSRTATFPALALDEVLELEPLELESLLSSPHAAMPNEANAARQATMAHVFERLTVCLLLMSRAARPGPAHVRPCFGPSLDRRAAPPLPRPDARHQRPPAATVTGRGATRRSDSASTSASAPRVSVC